jgi:AraC family ethanolamine operon transcriptional activator
MRTGDVDRLHDLAPGWVERSFHLGQGPFEGGLAFGQTARMQFARKDWAPGLLVRGAAPAGAAVLGFPLFDSNAGRIRGLTLGSHELGFIGRGEEVDFRTVVPYSVFIIAICQDDLDSYAEAVLGRPLRTLVRASRINGGRRASERVRELDRLGLDTLFRDPVRLNEPRISAWVENRLLDLLLGGLPFDDRPTHLRGAAALARRAEDYLLTNLQAPLTIADLCRAVGASERTLHQAFKVHLGSTPKGHLKVLRLNAVRRELREAAPGVGVMDVAMRWGFFHAGWFSQDYRRMFGESPSRTLQSRGEPELPAAGRAPIIAAR